MPFWGPVSAANLERVGPWFDVLVGTEGRYVDLNQAIADGFKRIVLATGAILTNNLALTASDGFIWSPYGYRPIINLGAYAITVTGSRWHLTGFTINGATGSGILVSAGQEVALENVRTENCTSHGVELTTTGNDCSIKGHLSRGNGGDGVNTAVGANHVRISDSVLYNNSGYGFNDAANDGIITGCRLAVNALGAYNPAHTGTVKAGNGLT